MWMGLEAGTRWFMGGLYPWHDTRGSMWRRSVAVWLPRMQGVGVGGLGKGAARVVRFNGVWGGVWGIPQRTPPAAVQ